MRRLNGGSPADETGKNKVPCHRKLGLINIPPCSKAEICQALASILQPVTDNGDISIRVKDYGVGRKTIKNQFINLYG
jgi:hypothetical protein